MGPISSSARSASSLADHASVVGGKEGRGQPVVAQPTMPGS